MGLLMFKSLNMTYIMSKHVDYLNTWTVVSNTNSVLGLIFILLVHIFPLYLFF
jgi:hypothetical protein